MKAHPLKSAVVGLVGAYLAIVGIWSSWSETPFLRALWAGVNEAPVIVRILVTLVLLVVLTGSLALLIKILLLVRSVPAELKNQVLRLTDQNAEQAVAMRQLKQDRDLLQEANSHLSAWKDGKRGWEAEREKCHERIAELEAQLACNDAKGIPSASTVWIWRQELLKATDPLATDAYKYCYQFLSAAVRDKVERFDARAPIDWETESAPRPIFNTWEAQAVIEELDRLEARWSKLRAEGEADGF